MFNGNRLLLARKRRALTLRLLAQAADVRAYTLSELEQGKHSQEPGEHIVRRLAQALQFPADFFYSDDAESLAKEAVSFRSLSRLTERERDCAAAAGQLGIELNKWAENIFSLPEADLPDMGEEKPDLAAFLLRRQWSLGELPIRHMIGLLETKGVRFFSLPENVKNVDAFSFWRNAVPYIFVNAHKTAERIIFDIAHELGHLILHQAATASEKERSQKEAEANLFASAFMMPENDIRAGFRGFIAADTVIQAKRRWRISAMALVRRLHQLNIITEQRYKSLCIELSRRGYRAAEPIGVVKENSVLWQKIFMAMWRDKISKNAIARKNHLFLAELEGLVGGVLSGVPEECGRNAAAPAPSDNVRNIRS